MAKKSVKAPVASKTMAPSAPGELPDLHMADDEPMPHEIDDAVDTLEKGEAIKKNPKLMPHVHAKIKSKMASLKSLKAMAGPIAEQEDGDSEDT